MKHGPPPRIALAQMDVHPGRPDRNVQRMLEFIAEARGQGAEVVAFPEMCIPGYMLGDLWEVDALMEDFAAYGDVIREASPGITVLFGNVAIDRNRIGEDGRLRKYNAAYVCHDGHFVIRPGVPGGLPVGVQPKTLLPNYRYFDEERHFYSLRQLAFATGYKVSDWLAPYEVQLASGENFAFGVQLCEDIWCQDYEAPGGEATGAVLDTLSVFHARGAQAVFNLSASPWTWQKNDKRNRVIREVLQRSPVPFYYVNCVGAQNNGKNILVFDGDTSAYGTDGEVRHRAPPWRESLLVVPDAGAPAPWQDETRSNYNGIVTGLHHLDRIRGDGEGGPARFLIGVSGGVDSSVVACLLREAFGPEQVHAVNMPTRFNADVTRNNARHLCRALGVDYLSFPIEDLYVALAARIKAAQFEHEPGRYTGLVDENIQARIRGADVLAGLASKCGLVYTNNGNKTETALGYATLYGDVNGAVAPIADLYKTQVFALARYLNESVYGSEVIPCNLYDGSTVPSAELSKEQDVTRGLGDPIKYGYHDAVLRQMIEYRQHPENLLTWYLEGDLLARLEWDEKKRFEAWFPDARRWIEDLEWVEHCLRSSYFKRIQAPPIIVLSKRAFGFDLRESQLPAYPTRGYRTLRERALGGVA
ncbi:MAG: NAD(+) synthase [Gammaproteobacteria bacterium]